MREHAARRIFKPLRQANRRGLRYRPSHGDDSFAGVEQQRRAISFVVFSPRARGGFLRRRTAHVGGSRHSSANQAHRRAGVLWAAALLPVTEELGPCIPVVFGRGGPVPGAGKSADGGAVVEQDVQFILSRHVPIIMTVRPLGICTLHVFLRLVEFQRQPLFRRSWRCGCASARVTRLKQQAWAAKRW
jgi:hypothetical protein